MSREWAALLPLALGHLAIFAVLLNVSHGLGHEERVSDRYKAALFAAFAGASAYLAWLFARVPLAAWPPAAIAYAAACLAVALIGLPVATAVRALRKVPDGVACLARSETDLAAEYGPEALIGPDPRAWMLRLPGNESLRVCRYEWEVAIPSLPPALDGLTLLHLTDLHFSDFFRREWFERLADLASEGEADLVVFTGDLVDDDRALDWIKPVLGRIRGRLGNFAILGNHDLSHQPREVRRRLEEAGFMDLEGRWTCLSEGGATMAVGGTSYPWGPALDPGDMPKADVRLLLSHSPDLLGRAARWGVDLMLSGHNHGGQIRLPVIGPVVMPSVYSRRYDRGFFRRGPTLLHVSQGLGGKHPIRYGCVPEFSRFILRARSLRRAGSDAVDCRREASGSLR